MDYYKKQTVSLDFDIRRKAQCVNKSELQTYSYNAQILIGSTQAEACKYLDQILKNNKRGTLSDIIKLFDNRNRARHVNTKMKMGEYQIKIAQMLHQMLIKELVCLIVFVFKNTNHHFRLNNLYNSKYVIYYRLQFKEDSRSYLFYFTFQQDKDNKVQLQKQSQLHESNLTSEFTNHYIQQNYYVNYFLGTYLGQPQAVTVLRGKTNFYILQRNDRLGKGGFGQVFPAESIKYQKEQFKIQPWAIKQYIKKTKQYETQYPISQDREYLILQKINKLAKQASSKSANNIIKFEEAITCDDRKYLVYELCPKNNLKEFMEKHTFNKKQVFDIAWELASTLKLIHFDLIKNQDDFLQLSITYENDSQLTQDNNQYTKLEQRQSKQKGIIHRDLKPANILIKHYSETHVELKLIDWGFSKRTYTQQNFRSIGCGTETYKAPEIDQSRYNCKVDVWSFGAILYELLSGEVLIKKRQKSKAEIKKLKLSAVDKISSIDFERRVSQPFTQDEKNIYRTILRNTIEGDPQKRWNSEQLYSYLRKNMLYELYDDDKFTQYRIIKKEQKQFQQHENNLRKQIEGRSKMTLLSLIQNRKFICELIDHLIRCNISGQIFEKQQHLSVIEDNLLNPQKERHKLLPIQIYNKMITSYQLNFSDYKDINMLTASLEIIIGMYGQLLRKSGIKY